MISSALLVLAAIQGPPATDIYVADLVRDGGTLTVARVRNVTRRAGYDNQPTFLPDGRAFLYTCAWQDGQTEICHYHLDPQAVIARLGDKGFGNAAKTLESARETDTL